MENEGGPHDVVVADNVVVGRSSTRHSGEVVELLG